MMKNRGHEMRRRALYVVLALMLAAGLVSGGRLWSSIDETAVERGVGGVVSGSSDTAAISTVQTDTSLIPTVGADVNLIQTPVALIPTVGADVNAIQTPVVLIPTVAADVNLIQTPVALIPTVGADVNAIQTPVALIPTVGADTVLLLTAVAEIEAQATIIPGIMTEVQEIERHVHNYGRSFGAKDTPTATRFAESVGVLGAAADDAWFQFSPGNINVWGSWVQIWGPDDAAAILPAGRQAVWDIHKIRLTDANDDKKTYIMQLATGTTYTAALAAGTYSEFDLFIEKGDKAPAPSPILTDRESAVTCAWVRILTTDGDNGSWLRVVFEAHGYPE